MKKFKKVYIEITNACNLSCSFCPKTMRKPQFMDEETFSNILDQIKGHTEHIYFHVKGEPLLHPEIDKFLDISYAKGYKVNITTNGTLTGKVGHKLLNRSALRQVNFSLHSFEGNEVTGDIDEYLYHIIDFIREAGNTDLLISLRFWNLSKSNSINLQREKNRYMLQVIEKEFNLPYKIEDKIPEGRGIKISDRVYVNQDYEFKWPGLYEEEGRGKSFCYGLRNHAAILVDGTVVPCCLDGEGVINLGNIHDTHFSEIVESKRASSLIGGFSRGEAVEELCKRCGYRERFSEK